MDRAEIVAALGRKRAEGKAIIATSAGIGITAKAQELGGTDLIVAYNGAMLGIHARNPLYTLAPLGVANMDTKRIGRQVLPVIRSTPVIAGIFASDPFQLTDTTLHEMIQRGFSGVTNLPSIGSYTGDRSVHHASTGVSFNEEVSLMEKAKKQDIFTMAIVYTDQQYTAMKGIGVDVLVIDRNAEDRENGTEACEHIQRVCASGTDDAIILFRDDNMTDSAAVQDVLTRTGLHGYFSDGLTESEPMLRSIQTQIAAFKRLRLK